MRIGWTAALVSVLGLTVSLTGCGGDGASSSGGGASGGRDDAIVIDGSSTVYRISRAAQLDYKKVDPGLRINVANHGTGGGFDRYMQGEVDIIDASRDAKPEETSKAEELGLPWTRFLVAYDGITVVVNPQNDFVKSLTVEQLRSLFAPDGTARTWKDLDPSWPDRKIVLYAPGTASGTFDFFVEAVVGKGVKTNRSDVQASEEDNVLVMGIAGDPDGLGYFGFAYYQANKDKLRAIPIQETATAPAVEPTHETILSGQYKPLSRPLYIFVKNDLLKRERAARFVAHYLENAARFAESAGYVAPTEKDLAENAERFRQASGGRIEGGSGSQNAADARLVPADSRQTAGGSGLRADGRPTA
ncbi:MAG: phosphate ABC transporter substrate-binding protein [Isosphaeraceae bacterium]|jgi:phosphate transport system substrate-binding protein|nr:MAG: phosphate ABC transporter substrate-binding protein [Isosphaeraceae bacterium]